MRTSAGRGLNGQMQTWRGEWPIARKLRDSLSAPRSRITICHTAAGDSMNTADDIADAGVDHQTLIVPSPQWLTDGRQTDIAGTDGHCNFGE